MVAGLGRCITQLDVLSLSKEKLMLNQQKMSSNVTSRYQPLLQVLLHLELWYSWSPRLKRGSMILTFLWTNMNSTLF